MTHKLPNISNANPSEESDMLREMMTLGFGVPVEFSWVDKYWIIELSPFKTHKFPEVSNINHCGEFKEALKFGEIVTFGVGFPLEFSWDGRYLTIVLLPAFVTHKLPETSNASPSGLFKEVPSLEIVTFGVGFPLEFSWDGRYFTIVLLLRDAQLFGLNF